MLDEATCEKLPMMLEFNRPVRVDLQGFDLDEVWSVLEAVRRNETPPPPPLKPAEYAYLQDVPFGREGDAPNEEEDEAHFFARRLAPNESLPDGVERIVLIHELREVRAQVGFTRLAPSESDLDGETQLDEVKTALLSYSGT